MTVTARPGAYRNFSAATAYSRWTVRPIDFSPSRVVRVEPCACGRIVAIKGTTEEDLVRGIVGHNASPEHQAYRRRRARDGEPAELACAGID